MTKKIQKSKKVTVFSISILVLFCIAMIAFEQKAHTEAGNKTIPTTSEYIDMQSNYDIYRHIRIVDEKNSRKENNKSKDLKDDIGRRYSLEDTIYIDEDGKAIITNPDDILVLVNKDRNLSPYYEPDDLIMPDVPFPFDGDIPKKYMRKEAAHALEELFKDAKKAGVELYALSGYRPYKAQEHNFKREAQEKGNTKANETVAYPGQSEHQTGLAMDITRKCAPYLLDYDFGQTTEGIWLYNNCYKYGFIIRYPEDKEDITGYKHEPWHIRYVGCEVAKYLYDNNLALEELFIEYRNN